MKLKKKTEKKNLFDINALIKLDVFVLRERIKGELAAPERVWLRSENGYGRE